MLKKGVPLWVCSRICIPQQQSMSGLALPSGRKKVPALLLTKQPELYFIDIWKDLKTQSNSALWWKNLVKAHSRAPACVGRHLHAHTQFPAEQPELFEEWFRQSAGKLSRDPSPRRLHSFPGSIFSGLRVHTHTQDLTEWFNIYKKDSREVGERANTVELILD